MTSVLIVEDEPSLAKLVRDYCVQAGYQTWHSGTAGGGLQRFVTDAPDLIVLDLGLPDRDGLDVIREVRRTSNTPIIILTARGDETDRVVGLELGADDYMVKPFSPRELVARIRAVLRRGAADLPQSDVLHIEDLEIDVPRRQLRRDGVALDFTATEFDLIVTLAREPGRVLTRAQLLDAIHGVIVEAYERAIDAHIKNIRRKLEPDSAHPKYILTVHGVGYKFLDAR
jgi:two-component system alkaline phosphatase synthesis response regulator PhoP